MGKDHGFSGCSPVFQGSQLCTSPASIAPSISCLFSFPTLNSNWIPTHMFCLSCGHGRPLPSPTPISSSLFIAWVMPCTPGSWDKWRGERVHPSSSGDVQLACICRRFAQLKNTRSFHLLPKLSKEIMAQSYYIYPPQEISFGSLFS